MKSDFLGVLGPLAEKLLGMIHQTHPDTPARHLLHEHMSKQEKATVGD